MSDSPPSDPDRDRRRESRFEEIREQIQVGIRQADRGEVAPLNARETLAKIRERRRDRGGEAR